MRLFKKETTNNYVIPKDLSISATGMFNSLLISSDNELKNNNFYSINKDSKKDVEFEFR